MLYTRVNVMQQKKLAHLLLVFIEVIRSCDLTYEMVAKKCAAKTKHLIVLPQKFNSDKKI